MTVRPSHASGSSNWVFRLGDAHAVRLPRSDGYTHDFLKEVRWLLRLGPAASVPVPNIEFVGEASDLFPRPWAVVSWVPGDSPVGLQRSQQAELATTLGQFMQSRHAVGRSGIPEGAEH
ncbi:phosphotransferase [Georgenia halophila]